jgi:malonyl-CoA O-methyltransferase
MVPDHIVPERVKRAFAAAADRYDEYAVLQREIGERLLAHLDFTKLAPRRILDIGCGTGYFTALLHSRFPRADIVAVDIAEAMVRTTRGRTGRRWPWQGRRHALCADGCHLPLTGESFDLVCSNLTMQWVAEPPRMLREMRRVLAPGGLMLFSTFGRRTLQELRQSLASIEHARAGLVLPFPDVTDLGNALMELAVELPVTDTDLFTLTYPDPMALVRELKGIGASSAAIRHRPGGLYGRALLKRLAETYARQHPMPDGRVHATFEALYGQAWHARADYRHGEHVIPIRIDG